MTTGAEVGVRERSSILRGQRETVTVKLDWKPPKATAGTEAAEAESRSRQPRFSGRAISMLTRTIATAVG
ncbi:hypothetical protein C485_10390 [Natrinema altunense JCM 12890]|uniref:Uncharacterized protein n=1 Tax=Natrinema altunense (strain JCM 12890 / CGMCC 1.3731 / AJ2) TaxID=1227494 RepID=L9ZIS0_NATA2|nr:hypothetical protein C485_10390 [Natrinema altunense JCM 12890]